MGTTTIDLAVGMSTGMEVLRLISPSEIRSVVPSTKDVAEMATALGFTVTDRPPGGDYLFSIHWPRLIPPDVLATYGSAINVHPGYLPSARGMYPVFWAVLEGGPAGATVHHMVEKVDAGPIIERVQVPYGERMTGGEVWRMVADVEVALTVKYIRLMRVAGLPHPIVTDEPLGRNRTLSEFLALRDKPPLQSMSSDQVRRLKLALTHPDHPLPVWAVDHR